MMNLREKIKDYLEYCQFQKELDAKTLKAYRIDLRQFFEIVACDEPDKSDIQNYITDLHKKYKQKTVKRKIASVKAYYNHLEEEEMIENNPFRKIRAKFKETLELPRIIPRTDIEHLLNYAYSRLDHCPVNGYREMVRDVAVIELLFATGARVYEIANIKSRCIDLSSGVVCFMGKGGKERYVQVAEKEVLELLRKYYAVNREGIERSGFFLVNRQGNRYTEQSIRDMLRKYSRQAGIVKKITPHMFRHSFATYLIEEGVDISCVQQILGHSSIKTTQIYIHVATRKQAEILQNLHPRKRMKIHRMA